MSRNDLKSLSELIGSADSDLGRLAARARAKIGLTDHIRAGLAPTLAAEVVHCNLEDDGTLIVRVAGPEWASRLRFESERLLALGRERHPGAVQVRVRVAHPAD